jgi:hypothetical protein
VLSDRERETLREVQRQLVSEDPRFARSFDAVGKRDSSCSLKWAYAMPRWAYTTAMVVTVMLSLLMLVTGGPGTALAFAALATMISAVRRHRDNTGWPER